MGELIRDLMPTTGLLDEDIRQLSIWKSSGHTSVRIYADGVPEYLYIHLKEFDKIIEKYQEYKLEKLLEK